jgi:hypothetical protein
VVTGRWLRGEVALDASKAELKVIASPILRMKTKAPDDYYTTAELNSQEADKIRIGIKIADTPPTYKVTRKPKQKETDPDADFGAMAELKLIPSSSCR